MAEALGESHFLVAGEILRRCVPGQGIVLGRGLQVLADGEDVAAGVQDVIHQCADLLLRLAKAHHKAGFGEEGGVLLLAVAQHVQRPLVTGLGPHGGLELLHGLDVVVQHLRVGGDDDVDR